jgi:hypothetical protein
MTPGKNDDAATTRQDMFLAGLIPQAAEHLAEQHAGDFDAEAGQTRFLTWLTTHTEEPAGASQGARAGWHDAKPVSARSATPMRIIGDLLLNHPEASSLLARASHSQALAAWSAATTRRRLAAALAARLAHEELGHLLEPRRRRTVNFGAGLAVLAALAAGIFLELLPVALHGFGIGLGWPAVSGHVRGNVVSGSLISVLILVLTGGAAALISRMEPAPLLLARRRWHRARAAYEEAVRMEQADFKAAAAATEAWLGLVRARATAIAAGEDRLVQDTTALAAVLVESGRPQLPPSG